MAGRTLIDISQYSYEEFVSFLFARDVQTIEEQGDLQKWDPWDLKVEVKFNPERVCEYYTCLFERPGFLLQRFSKAQLEEGFWALQGPNLDCAVPRILDANPPLAVREKCVRAMSGLYRAPRNLWIQPR
jgi:hypothetical protein